MSLRGPRRGRGRGRGRGTGRGRGRGKTTTWEWHNNYSPGPEVYAQLWHLRKEPAIVTPFLPAECPVRNAQSRILDRRQTEGDIQRNFYVVEVKHSPIRKTSVSSADGDQEGTRETLHVDLSRILEYVSPDELEHFENEQFRIEAEAEAVVMRAQAAELAQKRLRKNARAAATDQGHIREDMGETRPRGRPRGRGRGRGRRSWRGRSTLVESRRPRADDAQEELVDAEIDDNDPEDEQVMDLVIAETDSEEEDELARPSPVIARSAFVANSALPVSPVFAHRRPSINQIALRYAVEESSDVESGLELEDVDNRLMSSAALQLRIEDDTSEEKDSYAQHRSKRRRTESTTSDLPVSFAKAALVDARLSKSKDRRVSPVPETSRHTESSHSDAYDQRKLAQFPLTNGRPQARSAEEPKLDNDQVHTPDAGSGHEQASGDKDQDAEEYVVETIVEHYREAGKTYFLVKWQGYEDSHDWLPEEDLEGASELVAEYKHRERKREGKKKMK